MTWLSLAGRAMLRAVERMVSTRHRKKRIVLSPGSTPPSLLRDIGLLDGRDGAERGCRRR